MSLIPLQLPPGVHRNGTEFESSNRWRDGSLVRWHDGSMRPVGGWTVRETTGDSISGVCRGMMAWIDNGSGVNLSMGTSTNLYVITPSGIVSDITPTGFITGEGDSVENTGYGGNYYGIKNYGDARPNSGVFGEATSWSLDTWGEYLVGCTSKDGKIYEWSLDSAIPAAVVANAPLYNRAIIVTEERFLLALGAGGNPRKVAWCDREDNTLWIPDFENEAGDMELQTQGAIMCGVNIRGRTLILTDQDAHTATYSGPPYVYGFERVGTACGISSRKAIAAIDEGAFWMGHKSFYTFNGSVAQEIKCDVLDYVFDDINRDQITKVHAVHNSQHGEVWWFYPSASSNENDRYVALDYKEGHWSIGTLDRTAGVDRGVYSSPIWCDASGDLYNHETGHTHGADKPYAESGPISLGNGDKIMKVTNLIPDEETQGEVKVTFKTRMYPNDTESTHGPFALTNPTGVRFTGRQMRLKVEGVANENWRSGVMRIEARTGGKR